MFKQLGNKIILSLTITLSIFLVLTSFTLYTIIRQNIYTSFVKTSTQYLQQKFQTFQIQMLLAEEISKLVYNNSEIMQALDTPTLSADIEPFLDGIKNTDSNFSIIGIYLYSDKGLSYSTSNIGSIPAYDAIKKDLKLDPFLLSVQQSLWLIRDRNIEENINIRINEPYNTDYGLLTFVSKIYDGRNEFKGIMLVNIDIMKLYNLFAPQKPGFFSHASTYVLKEERILPHPRVSRSLSDSLLIAEKNAPMPLVYKNNIILYHTLANNDNTRIITVIPFTVLLDEFKVLAALLLFIIFLFIPCFLAVSWMVSKSITAPLCKLYEKMEKPL